jgi:hypothetical protein
MSHLSLSTIQAISFLSNKILAFRSLGLRFSSSGLSIISAFGNQYFSNQCFVGINIDSGLAEMYATILLF